MNTKAPMETETMARLYLELSQVVGGVAKTRREIVMAFALMQCGMYFRDSDPTPVQEKRWEYLRALCFAALDHPSVIDLQGINSEYFRIMPILDPPLPHPGDYVQ